jgi:hypothetical protein
MLGVSVRTFERNASTPDVCESAVRLCISNCGLRANGRQDMGNFFADMSGRGLNSIQSSRVLGKSFRLLIT